MTLWQRRLREMGRDIDREFDFVRLMSSYNSDDVCFSKKKKITIRIDYIDMETCLYNTDQYICDIYLKVSQQIYPIICI